MSVDRKATKKTQVVPVKPAGFSSWQSSESTIYDGENEAAVSRKMDGFNVGLLDFMSVPEFVQLMKTSTNCNYDALYGASSELALQLKASKSLLTLNSYMTMGKTKSEILEKLIESMRFTLAADHVYVYDFTSSDNSMVISHSDNIPALGKSVLLSQDSLESQVFYDRKVVCESLDKTYDDTKNALVAQCDALAKFRSQHVMCAPIIVDNEVVGLVRVNRGAVVDHDRQTDPFGDQEEAMIGYVTTNLAYLAKYSAVFASANSNSPTTSTAKMPVSASTSNAFSIDEVLEWVVNGAYSDFGADRVSLFAYNVDRQELECIVSPDAVGTMVSIKKGIAGEAFTKMTVVNVANVADDSRHNKDVDTKTKYTTKSLLCAPVCGHSGHAIGVVQVINKNGGVPFTAEDEAKIKVIAKRISILLQTKSDMQFCYLEKNMFSSLSAIIYQILSAQSVDEMIAAAKISLTYLVQADFVEVFDFDSSSTGEMFLKKITTTAQPIARGNGMRAVSAKLDSPRHEIDVGDDVIKSVPKTVLDCIRRGEMSLFSEGSGPTEDFLPGLPAKIAAVFPVGSKVFAGNPCKQVLVIARTKSSSPFSIAEKQALEVFVELLGSAMQTVQRLARHDEAAAKKDWEMNMVIKALSLLHNYVMLLDSTGVVTACNKTLSMIAGNEPKLNTHISKWFSDDQKELRDDIVGVYSSGCCCHRDCILIKSPAEENGMYVSYSVCPVGYSGDIHGVGEPALAKDDIGAVIIILHTHSNDEEGVKKLRKVLAAKAGVGDVVEQDTSTVSGTMNAVAQAVCEIGGRFELNHDDQKEVNEMAASLMKVGRNMRVSMVSQKLPSPEALVLVNNEAAGIENLFTWEFDVNQYSNKATLRGILGRLFESMFNLSDIHINTKTLCNFFFEAEKHYHDNPFHNFYHITCVTHFCYMLMKASKGVELLNGNMFYIFSVMLSAVVHDIDHPGNSNLYEINSKSELALLYNEQSVLESHHCSMAFRIMRYNNSDVLGELPPSNYKDVKKTIVNCILATDMSVHFELIDLVKKKVASGWDLQDSNDIFFFCRIILHASDLSNPVRPFHLAKLWAGRICAEFNNQVELEKKLDLPVLGFMITPDEKTLCKNEIGFASFVVAPMWRNLELLFPDFAHLVVQLNNNLDQWKGLLDNLNKAETGDDKKS